MAGRAAYPGPDHPDPLSAFVEALQRQWATNCGALFNSACFLLWFLPVTLAGYWGLGRWRQAASSNGPLGSTFTLALDGRRLRLVWLTAASLVFYSLYDVRFAVLLVLTAVVDFAIALRIERHHAAGARGLPSRRRWLAASVAFNLALLAFFKYAMFAAENARGVLALLGTGWTVPGFTIVLPVGISFFTFKTMSYTIEVYRGDVAATHDLVKYVAFVTLFPEMVAGPIVRYEQLGPQLDALPRRLEPALASRGLTLFAVGLAKKVIVADTLAQWIQVPWASASAPLSLGDAWLAVTGYTLQLYFDFSGYSDMAIGLACLLGLQFPLNFDAPYQSRSPQEFWTRWHITLGAFLRDYLYKPLGGNRLGESRLVVNLMVVMVLGGLWHGASWTFIVWGAYHGFVLVLHRVNRDGWARLPTALQVGLTLALVMAGWVWFRAESVPQALQVFRSLVMGIPAWGALTPLRLAALAGLMAVCLRAPPAVRWPTRLGTRWSVATGVLLGVAVALSFGGVSPFLYYQF